MNNTVHVGCLFVVLDATQCGTRYDLLQSVHRHMYTDWCARPTDL